MAILLIGLAVAACILTSGSAAFGPAIANVVASVWSNGVITNYSHDQAQSVPNWAAALSALTAVLSIGFIVYGLAT